AEEADLIRQQMPVRIDGYVPDIGEHARDKIGAAAPRHLQPLGYRVGDPGAFHDDVAPAPLRQIAHALNALGLGCAVETDYGVGAEIPSQLKPEIGAVDRDDRA